MKIKLASSMLFAGLCASIAFAQPAVKPAPAAAPVAAKAAPDPAVKACREKNHAAHKEIVEMYKKAKTDGKIDPKEAKEFAAMEHRLNNHAKFLAKDGFTVADCATMAKDLEKEKANVTRMAGTPAAAPAKPAMPAPSSAPAAPAKPAGTK